MRTKKILAIIMAALAVIIAFAVTIVCLTNKYADGLDNAITLAMSDAQCNTDTADNYTSSVSFQEGIIVYRVDFICNGFEHKYIISSLNDKIISKERKPYAALPPSETTVQVTESNIITTDNIINESTSGITTATEPTVSNVTSEVSSTYVAEPVAAETTAAETSTSTQYPKSEYIGIDRAKEIALQHAGVDASKVIFTKAKLDREHGMRIYKIEFEDAVIEYEFEIHAVSGEILEYSKEPVDD